MNDKTSFIAYLSRSSLGCMLIHSVSRASLRFGPAVYSVYRYFCFILVFTWTNNL